MEHPWAKTAHWKSTALYGNGPAVVGPSSSVVGWEQQEEEWPQHEHCGEFKGWQLEASVSINICHLQSAYYSPKNFNT